MKTPHGIIVFGAAGSGTSTIGKELARLLGFAHFDTDDFHWQKTDPPFIQIHTDHHREVLFKSAVDVCNGFVASGCMREWGEMFKPMFIMAAFVKTPTILRIKRLEKREFARYGQRILSNGDLFNRHRKFIEYAASYDDGGLDMRSLASQENWAKTLPCPVICVDGSESFHKIAFKLANALSEEI